MCAQTDFLESSQSTEPQPISGELKDRSRQTPATEIDLPEPTVDRQRPLALTGIAAEREAQSRADFAHPKRTQPGYSPPQALLRDRNRVV